MGLHVRLRHALGERVFDLPGRDVSKPWMIGRGSEADLKVPSVSVAPQHAALFVHEGQWIIQGHGGIVTLNGEPLEMAASLQVGDVIGLGIEPHAPTLEINPVGAAANRAGSAPIPAPASVPRHATRIGTIRPAQPVPLDDPPPPQAAEEAGDGDTIEWDAQTLAPAATEFYIPKGRQTPAGLIVAAVVFGMAILAAVAIVAHQKARQPAVVVLQSSPAVLAPTPLEKPQANKMFDLDADQASADPDHAAAQPGSTSTSGAASIDLPMANAPAVPLEPKATASPAAPTSISAAPRRAAASADEDPPDPDDPEWREIEHAHFNVRHQGVAVVKYDEYRRAHPGKYTAWLDQYTEDAANWLYWQRVAQLCKRQDDLTAQINQKKIDLRNQPSGPFHDELVKDKADLDARLAATTKLLTDEMGYTNNAPPDLEKPSELRQLSAQRDPAKYAAFKKRVLKYARDHHGSIWWEGE
jgi:hypothetical protein